MYNTIALIHTPQVNLPDWYEVYTDRGMEYVSPGRPVGVTADNGHTYTLGIVKAVVPTRHENYYIVRVAYAREIVQ